MLSQKLALKTNLIFVFPASRENIPLIPTDLSVFLKHSSSWQQLIPNSSWVLLQAFRITSNTFHKHTFLYFCSYTFIRCVFNFLGQTFINRKTITWCKIHFIVMRIAYIAIYSFVVCIFWNIDCKITKLQLFPPPNAIHS